MNACEQKSDPSHSHIRQHVLGVVAYSYCLCPSAARARAHTHTLTYTERDSERERERERESMIPTNTKPHKNIKYLKKDRQSPVKINITCRTLRRKA